MKTIPQAFPAQALAQTFAAKPAMAPVPAATDLPPWIEADHAPLAAPAHRRPHGAAPVARAEFEAVHWSVVLLTLFTAASVLLGAFGGDPRPKELLPIIITVAG